MAIPLTRLHKTRLFDQIRLNLLNLQNDMVRNAQTHKAMAAAKNPDVATLRGFVTDCEAAYATRLKWVSDFRGDATKRQHLSDALKASGWVESDLTDVADALGQANDSLAAARIGTYADIISACDAMLASVSPPPSLWPE